MHAFALPPGADPQALQTALRERFAVEVPVIDMGGRPLLRISAQGYNRPEDYEVLAEGLRVLLA